MFKKYLTLLIGDINEFSLESRIFHGICVVTAIVLLLAFPFNLAIGLYEMGFAFLAFLVILLFFYYHSRYHRFHKIVNPLYIFFLYLSIIASFLFNGGINGTALIVLIITFHILITIVKMRRLWIWLLIHLSLGFGMLLLEYYYPNVIITSYENIKIKYLDLGLTYLQALLIVYLTIYYIRINYNREESSAKKRLQELNKTNKEIVKQKQLLEEVNATKNKLFSIIAHDLTSPFQGILGLSEILDKEYESMDDKQRKDFIKDISNTSEATLQLLQNLLLWTKSQSHRIELQKEKINVFEIVKNSIIPYKTNASNKHINIDINIPPDIKIVVDRFTFSSIVTNLISNAIKFSHRNKTILVSANIIDNKLSLQVIDNGVGMDNKMLENLFNIEKVSSALGTEKETGTGLGLQISKEFVEMNGGNIYVESEVGKGSTFTIELPA